MKWEHKCSLDWLKARQRYITASDIKNLLPVTKTGRPRKVTDLDRLKVLASKEVELTDEDTMSYGAMARGHILEPYAVEMFNGIRPQRFYHWDDFLVTMPCESLAFSPDAMDIPMGEDPTKATAIMEIKSYSPAQHLSVAYTPKAEIEERWQVASAMALLPNIEKAYLVLYNPGMMRKMFIVQWDRDELADEIDMVREVVRDWDEFEAKRAYSFPPDATWSGMGIDESTIVEDLERAKGLNP